MGSILGETEIKKKAKGGKRLVLKIAYWWHLKVSENTKHTFLSANGMASANAQLTIKWIEDTLIKHPDFTLPGRKVLPKSDMDGYPYWCNGDAHKVS